MQYGLDRTTSDSQKGAGYLFPEQTSVTLQCMSNESGGGSIGLNFERLNSNGSSEISAPGFGRKGLSSKDYSSNKLAQEYRNELSAFSQAGFGKTLKDIDLDVVSPTFLDDKGDWQTLSGLTENQSTRDGLEVAIKRIKEGSLMIDGFRAADNASPDLLKAEYAKIVESFILAANNNRQQEKDQFNGVVPKSRYEYGISTPHTSNGNKIDKEAENVSFYNSGSTAINAQDVLAKMGLAKGKDLSQAMDDK